MGEFSPPPPPPFLNHADAQTSNTSNRLWFYYIITKIHPHAKILDPRLRPSMNQCVITVTFLCGLHEGYSHMAQSDLFIYLFIYLSKRVDRLSRGLVSYDALV